MACWIASNARLAIAGMCRRLARPLLRPYPAEAMESFPVSTRVGNVKNDDPGLIEPVAIQSALDLAGGAG